MIQKICKHIDKHTLKPQEHILIACVPESAKNNVILNADVMFCTQCNEGMEEDEVHVIFKYVLI